MRVDEVVNMKEDMTDQEWVFVKEYLALTGAGAKEESPLVIATYLAGYEVGDSDEDRITLGNAVLRKWQEKVDHKQVMASVGVTPEFVARQLKQIMESSMFDTCRVTAANIASKCLDMQKNTLEVGKGVELVIKRSKGKGIEEPEVFEHEMGAKKTGEGEKRVEGKKVRVKLGTVVH